MLVLENLIDDFVKSNPKSKEAFERARKLLPAGNTRAVLNSDPFPLVLSSGEGSLVKSVDGKVYIDFVSDFTAGLYGHSHPVIKNAVMGAFNTGFGLGGVLEQESQLAKIIQDRFPSMQKMRFCNSGTEANMYALATALVYTGRKKILAFDRGYHGGTMSFREGGNPLNLPHDFVIGKYNSIEENRHLLSDDLAAIIVEPMQAAGGMRESSKEFLKFLREAATKYGALLIFDECVTSRLSFHGMQGAFNVIPDITTLGKYLGGGFPFGAFGGQAEIMNLYDPSISGANALFHSGTFNGNTFTLTAAIAASSLVTPKAIDRLNDLGNRLRDGARKILNEAGREEIEFTGCGSEVGVHFNGPDNERLRDCFFFFLLQHGIMIGCRGFISLNLMHTEASIDKMLSCVEAFVGAMWKARTARL